MNFIYLALSPKSISLSKRRIAFSRFSLLLFITLIGMTSLFVGLHTAHAATANVFYSVGQSSSNLMTLSPTVTIASGMATFSQAQTGNIGVGDKVTYNTSAIAYISGKISQTQWSLVTATGT